MRTWVISRALAPKRSRRLWRFFDRGGASVDAGFICLRTPERNRRRPANYEKLDISGGLDILGMQNAAERVMGQASFEVKAIFTDAN